MKILIDTHTHTTASDHAYSSLQENAAAAANAGIRLMAMTDHAPAMLGAPTPYFFGNLRIIPDEICGVRMIRGAELNIMDTEGRIDLEANYARRLEFCLASLHEYCFEPRSREENTAALIAALKNPYVDAIGHPGNPNYPVDMEAVVKAAAACGKLLELNEGSFTVRPKSVANCYDMARLCRKHGVRVTCGTDAHISFAVGRYTHVPEMIRETGLPEELVLGASPERFLAYLEERKTRIARI